MPWHWQEAGKPTSHVPFTTLVAPSTLNAVFGALLNPGLLAHLLAQVAASLRASGQCPDSDGENDQGEK